MVTRMLEGRAPGSARHALTRPLALRTCLITRIDHAHIGSDPGRHALGQTDIAATPVSYTHLTLPTKA